MAIAFYRQRPLVVLTSTYLRLPSERSPVEAVVWQVADPALCQGCAEVELALVHW